MCFVLMIKKIQAELQIFLNALLLYFSIKNRGHFLGALGLHLVARLSRQGRIEVALKSLCPIYRWQNVPKILRCDHL